jgi:hypothetical protein
MNYNWRITADNTGNFVRIWGIITVQQILYEIHVCCLLSAQNCNGTNLWLYVCKFMGTGKKNYYKLCIKIYVGESVNRSYPPPTLIHLSLRFTSASKPATQKYFWLLSQPLPHLRFKLFVISETFATFLDPAVNRFTRQTLPTVNRKHFFMNILCTESFLSTKNAQTTALR